MAVDLPFLAAAIGYYALVSVLPALLLVTAVTTTVGGPALADRVTVATDDLLTPAGQAAIDDALTGAAGRVGASFVGLAVLLWSTLKVFRGLDIAFSRVYGSADTGTFLGRLRNAVIGLTSVGVGLLAMVAFGAVLAVLPLPVAGRILGFGVLLVGLFVAFLPLYSVFPGVPTTLRSAAPGAALAAAGWMVLQTGFQAYAAVAPSYELYGLLGGVLLLVTWFYLAAVLLLIGAVLNVELADDHGDRQAEEPADRHDGLTMDATDDDRPLEEQVAAVRDAVEALDDRLEEHTVPRSEVESDLRRYVRSQLRRGHARGWGPYLVLLYGTAMTIGAFYLLTGGWAILAMVVVWLSTLGLYVMMILTGTALNAVGLTGRAVDFVRDRGS